MIEALILGIVQGLTEFLPVSSSGHLVLFHDVFGMNEGGLAFDVALHLGTLFAVLIYFRNDIRSLFVGFFAGKKQARLLVGLLAVATLPAVFFGLLLQNIIESMLRSPWVVVAMLVMFGIFMIAAELQAETIKKKINPQKLSLTQVLVIGFLQACALIPGVSRSGATISGGLLVGLDRVQATRFSFLLAIPVILGAGAKVLLDEAARADIAAHQSMFVVGMVSAFLFGIAAITFLLSFVARYSIKTFAYYRFVLAAFITILLVLNR